MERRADGGLNINQYGDYSTDTQYLLLESEGPLNVLDVVDGFARKHKGERISDIEALIPKLEEDYNVKVKVPDGEVRITSLNGSIF